ncbi:MAG: alpha-ketoacid dehydrogenase subunit beta [Candidatus Diapherotrites archaeon]
MAELNMVEAINLALKQEMERDKNVLLIGEDVGINGGVFRVTDGLWKKFGAERVIDTPLSESGIVGASFGLALKGFRPVAEIQFSGFIYPAFDQIISHISRIRTRSRGRFTAPMVIRAPYSGGIHAPEHHSESPEAFFAHMPGIKTVIPSTPFDAKGLLASSIRSPDPIIFLEPKKIYRAVREEVPEKEYLEEIGKARVARDGRDASIFCWGAMVRIALEAAKNLKEKKGIGAEVIDLRTLSPLDDEAIAASVKKTGRAVVLHEAPRTCGFGAEVVAVINEKALLYLEAPVERVTGFDTVMPLYKNENYYLPDAFAVERAVEKAVNF